MPRLVSVSQLILPSLDGHHSEVAKGRRDCSHASGQFKADWISKETAKLTIALTREQETEGERMETRIHECWLHVSPRLWFRRP